MLYAQLLGPCRSEKGKVTPGKICVAVNAPDVATCEEILGPLIGIVDVVEMRLDGMVHPDVEQCVSRIHLPLLLTNRPAWEGGAYRGEEKERLRPLVEGTRLQVTYVDFELRAERHLREQLLREVRQSSTRLILSWHDFQGTPSAGELNTVLTQMHASGADIGKIVTTAHSTRDVLRVLALLEKAQVMQFPLCAFCMGEDGRISRFASLYLGGYMTYVAVDSEQITASGQFSAKHFYRLCSFYNDEN